VTYGLLFKMEDAICDRGGSLEDQINNLSVPSGHGIDSDVFEAMKDQLGNDPRLDFLQVPTPLSPADDDQAVTEVASPTPPPRSSPPPSLSRSASSDAGSSPSLFGDVEDDLQ
jgi:hypothetical protein